MENVASRYTPEHGTWSPFATVTCSLPPGRSWSAVREAASSVTKLWVEPESRRARRETPPSWMHTCIVSLVRMPVIAWTEIYGSSVAGSSAPESPSSSSSAKLRRKIRWQTRLWPRLNFSLQLKQRPKQRRSSISAWDRRLTCRPSIVIGVGWEAAGGLDAGNARRGGGAGRRPLWCGW
jgi:hypothetical protein